MRQAHLAVSIALADAVDQKTWSKDLRAVGGIYRGTVIEEDIEIFEFPSEEKKEEEEEEKANQD